MGLPILILGYSGSGKSASMRNFGEDEITLINVNGKQLPFRKNWPGGSWPWEKNLTSFIRACFHTPCRRIFPACWNWPVACKT